jgi:lysophospholipase L1-like esterase
MGRLLVFIGTAAALLVVSASLNWWVDPFGEFWKPGAVEDARASNPQCLVSHELIGGQYFPFKLDVFRSRPTQRFVTGSSRVLKIGSWPGEQSFANLGMPVISPEIVLKELRALPPAVPQTMYLGVEAFWFNPNFKGFDISPGFEQRARYLLSRSALEESVRILKRAPYVFLNRWHKEQVGPSCVIGRSRPALAWKLDGSRVWSFELDPKTYHPAIDPFTTDLHSLRTGIYAGWTELSSERLHTLEQVLAFARSRSWRVVGFTPPDGERYLRFFASNPIIGPRWREFGQLMPKLFRKYGYRWLDFRDMRSIPCRQSDFVDGGYHTDGACSMRMRERLDQAASRELTVVALGDSIPAAVGRECGCTAGYVTLYGRALSRATKKTVDVDNRSVPGSNSSDLLSAVKTNAGLRTALAGANAVIVTTGHNDTPWIRPSGSAASLGRNLDAILREIRRLRAGRPTLLRVTNFYEDQQRHPKVVSAYARAICAVAERHGAGCADVYRAFSPTLLAADGIHPSQAGHRLIARLLIRLGFGPYTRSRARSK